MSIKLESLRVFQAVAETGTLAAAAKRLNRTPSAISMTLAQLADDIGAPLFETDRKSRLTPLGQLVREESLRAITAFDKSVDAIHRHAKSTGGIVRVAAVPSATVSLLPDVIAAFHHAHPDVRVEISDGDSASVRARIERDKADIGIISARPGDPAEGAPIRSDDLRIVCKEGGPIHRAHLTSKSASDWALLQLEPLIENTLCGLIDHPAIADLRLASTLQARDTTTILSFVRRGFGASILPFDAVRNQPNGVEFFVPSQPLSQRELRQITQAHGSPREHILAFSRLLTI